MKQTTDNSNGLSPQEKENRDKLIELLHFPQLDVRLNTLKPAQRRTYEWLAQRQDYIRWMDSDSEHLEESDGFFWIRGNPGTGKSIAMKFLYRKLESTIKRRQIEDTLIISFFFNARGSNLEKSTLGLYRSLLYTVFSLDPSLKETFNHYRSNSYDGILQQGEWTNEHEQMLLEIFEEALGLLGNKGHRLYCYMDALDECPEREVREMISNFEDLIGRTETQNFRVCFSSRHYPQIRIRTSLTVTLEREHSHENDIKTFIDQRLELADDIDQDTVAKLEADILAKSSGIFLWVNLVVYELNEVNRSGGTIDEVWGRLREIPKAAKETEPPNGAKPLYTLFRDIIKRNNKSVPELVRLVQLVYCATRPLSPRELYVALQQTHHHPFNSQQVTYNVLKKRILDASKGLAEITKSEEPTVQFIHETVREFLEDGGLKAVSNELVDVHGHEMIKTSCMHQICAPMEEHLPLLTAYREILNSNKGYRASKNIAEDDRKVFLQQSREKFPFLKYAVENVLFHANQSKALGNNQASFLESCAASPWVALHNLFKYRTSSFYSANTPILYILSRYGCDHLIDEPTVSKAEYAREWPMEEFSSPFVCAMYNNHPDTARALAGLGPKKDYRNSTGLSWANYEPSEPLCLSILRMGD